ncbi:MAG TPA: serine hydrolase domain-containing protein [Thermoanaerobaculia bacterium]|jgi:CubicO group peptidase (beta-lactamase class C family)|nr:serine hydrolase domain-containing protein [Thermoanaerobaculia bacterium]
MRCICWSLLALTLLSCNGSPRARVDPPPDPPGLEQELEAIRRKHDLPGLAAVVVRGGKVVSSAVAGVRRMSAGDPLRIGDRFHIASCTKSMTATLAAILVEEGRLQWTSRLADVLPELRSARREYQGATLEQLLAHAARMPAYTQFGPERLEELKALRGSPTEQRLAFLSEVLAAEEPNEGTGDAAYSNVGYTAAAAMLERAAGESWENLIQSRLIKPLGMTSVGFGWPATSRTPDQPRGHFRRNGEIVEQPLDDSYLLPVVLWPAGAVNSSIGDLGRYAADHLNGLLGRKALLPQAVYDKLHRTPDGAEQGFTLGWGVRRDARWGVLHYGAGSGGTFFVRIAIAPEHDVAVAVASNSGEAAAATREAMESLLAQPGPDGVK